MPDKSNRRPAQGAPSPSTGFGANAVRDISAALNVIVADVFALYMKTKNFHWHMSGPHLAAASTPELARKDLLNATLAFTLP